MSQPASTPAISISGSPGSKNFPHNLSTTPGGTIYATTPGGTKIVYDRNALLFLRNSPLSKTPPSTIPLIPGVTAPDTATSNSKPTTEAQREPEPSKTEEEEMFKME
ncbi:eukaryotic initiation factor 4E binding [Balamuthia mandrillaris]